MSLAAEERRQTVSTPFERARAMPPSVCTSPEFIEQELKGIFARDWYCVGRVSALAAPGDYVTVELADQPIVVMRRSDGQLAAMSNVCLQRMSTLLQGRRNTRRIVCPYHAWTYNLDGTLRGAPAMNANDGFCKADYRLPEIRYEEWLGWVFVTLDAAAPSVRTRRSSVETLVGDYDMGSYVETFFETHVWDTDWKVLAENFMESYHLPVCHAGTIGSLSQLDEMICPPGEEAFNYHTILKDESLRIAMAHPNNTRLTGKRRRTAYLLSIYPSLMITLTPGYFWYLKLHSEGVGKVRIGFGGSMSRDYVEDTEAQAHFTQLKALLDQLNEEDRGCTEQVYRGLRAATAKPGHLSHLERPNYDFAN